MAKSIQHNVAYVACGSGCASAGGDARCSEGCIGCGACVTACPHGAIALVDGIARVDRSKCTGCGLCAKKCPAGAIRIEDNCAHIDGVDCLSCGMCAVVCPHGAIHDRTGIATGV